MALRVKYIGNDLGYWRRVQETFLKIYNSIEMEFLTKHVDESFNHKEFFVEVYNEKIDILYVDFSIAQDNCLQLCKLLGRNNETRLISVVGLFEYTKGDSPLIRAISASVRINHYKSLEIHDVVYDPIALLDVNMTVSPPYVRSKELEDFQLSLPVRIGYIDNNCFHVETNSYLQVGEIVDVSWHPLQTIMPSTKVFVQKFYDRDLYYNYRFSYDLEFIYVDNDYFSQTNKNWLLYKELKNKPEELEQLDEHEKAEILADMAKRKKIFSTIKNDIDQWLLERHENVIEKKLKILIVDASLDIFNALEKDVDSFRYSLNIQTVLTGDFYHIERTTPHLIVFRLDEQSNSEQVISLMIEKIQSIDEYDPYILIFNCTRTSQMMRDELNYENCLSYSGDLFIDEIKHMAKILDSKRKISDSKRKVFLKLKDEKSVMFIKKEVKVLGMTESILYFESKLDIPMWTVFRVDNPVKMLITIVPHKNDGFFKTEKNVYRSLINGAGEKEKAQIRQLINQSFKEVEDDSKLDEEN